MRIVADLHLEEAELAEQHRLVAGIVGGELEGDPVMNVGALDGRGITGAEVLLVEDRAGERASGELALQLVPRSAELGHGGGARLRVLGPALARELAREQIRSHEVGDGLVARGAAGLVVRANCPGPLARGEAQIDRSDHSLERAGSLGHGLEVGAGVAIAVLGEAAEGAPEDHALVEPLGAAALVGAARGFVDVPLGERGEDAIGAHLRGAAGAVEHDGALAVDPLLRGEEREEPLADGRGRALATDGLDEPRELDRERELGAGRRVVLLELALGVVEREAAHHRAHGAARVLELIVGLEFGAGREPPADGDQRVAIVELPVEGVGALVVGLEDDAWGLVVDARALELLPGVSLVADRVGDLAPDHVI